MGGAAAGLPESLGPLRLVTEGGPLPPAGLGSSRWPFGACFLRAGWGQQLEPEMASGALDRARGVLDWLLGVRGAVVKHTT